MLHRTVAFADTLGISKSTVGGSSLPGYRVLTHRGQVWQESVDWATDRQSVSLQKTNAAVSGVGEREYKRKPCRIYIDVASCLELLINDAPAHRK